MKSKNYFLVIGLLFLCLAVTTIVSCSKEEPVVIPPATKSLATLTTTAISEITETSATSGANVTSDGNATVSARGVCWNTTPSTTITNSKTSNRTGNGSFVSNITGLTANTTYYVRSYAINSEGVAYGEQREFTTTNGGNSSMGTFTDSRDQQTYKTVKIGNQTWFAENLNYNTTTGWWWYDNDSENGDKYGRLYTWDAATTACPSGWHLPSSEEWTTLTNYLTNNGYGYGGSGDDIAKSMASSSGWEISSSPGKIGNDQATNNSSGFNGFPGGIRTSSGLSTFLGTKG